VLRLVTETLFRIMVDNREMATAKVETKEQNLIYPSTCINSKD